MFNWKTIIKKEYILFLILLATIGGVVYVTSFGNNSEKVLSGEVSVYFDENGFSPDAITILNGTRVTFVNNSKHSFWPASDLHPTHSIYSEFDSRMEIPSGNSWSFVFDKLGLWKYHDHLNASRVGFIRVVSSIDEKITKRISIGNNCDDIVSENEKLYCFQELLREASSQDGIIAGLEILSEKFQTDPIFAQNCHAIAHTIGEEAYVKFALGVDFAVDDRTAYCGYGFYHGFMEKFLSLESDVTKAGDFCKYLGRESIGGSLDKELACYHGIGHGVVDGSDKSAWGDEWALTEPGLRLCDQVVKTENEGYRCYSGAFNSISIAYASNLFGLEIDKEDPLWFCREQKEERYKLPCYTDMMVALMVLEDDDLAKAAEYLDVIEKEYFEQSMVTLSSLAVRQRLNTDNFDDIINICHSFIDNVWRISCIKGFSGGMMEFGEPTKEYIKGVMFCNSELLTTNEKIECHESIIDYANAAYPKDRLQLACELIPEELQSDRVIMNCVREKI